MPNLEQDFRDRFSYALSTAILENYLRTGEEFEDIADQVGVSRYVLERWSRGKSIPHPIHLESLAVAISVPVEFLVEPPVLPVYPFPKEAYEVSHGPTKAREVTVYPTEHSRATFNRTKNRPKHNLVLELGDSQPTRLRLLTSEEMASSPRKTKRG